VLPKKKGMDVLKRISGSDSDLPVIMITAHGSIDAAVEAMRLGAFTYVCKPFDLDEIVLSVRQALETTSLRREVRQLRNEQKERYGWANIVGRSKPMLEVFGMMQRIIESDPATVLVQGESGTGKDLVAKAIHYQSRRADKPFMNITCTAISKNLLESELMGHERGAFTDAKTAKKGLLELADGGTVFLDEMGSLPMSLQSKLLRFLEDKSFKRVGGTRDITVDVRVIASTNRDLKAAVEEGTFRGDLYYRLNVVPLTLPPLRERKEDIPLLVNHFIDMFNREFRKRVREISAEAMEMLMAYHWPGNVRELKNMIERAIILSSTDVLSPEDFPSDLREPRGAPAVQDGTVTLPPQGLKLEEVERSLVLQALERCGWNQTQAGKLLGLNRDQVRYRIEKYGLQRPE
jgi:DNA-binding NtrC family response regulator